MIVRFADHVALLTAFVACRQEIIEQIESRLLNVRARDASLAGTREAFAHAFTSCFFDSSAVPRALVQLRGQLAARHASVGFEPVVRDAVGHELDPLELVLRAYQHWDDSRWPGKNGRLAYARSLYAVYVLRQLEHLSLRIWDDGHERAPGYLREVQRLLDSLNQAVSPFVLVRDARWLIQTAQGPLTRHLEPYFTVADQISTSFTDAERLEIHKAGARLAGGHLRSQWRHRIAETNLPADDPEVLSTTRNSNAMDGALLVRDLVALLEAYDAARIAGDPDHRLDLADALLQGLTADPELFLTRLDLLGPCTTIEPLFIERGEDQHARWTPLGNAHRAMLARYGDLIGRCAEALHEDASALDPGRVNYSPLGMAYGFCADLLANVALATLTAQPSARPSLEDMFVSRDDLDAKLARAQAWEKLAGPAGGREHVEYSADWARQVFAATMSALAARARHRDRSNASSIPDARVLVVPRDRSLESLPPGFVSDEVVRAQEHCVTSDVQRAFANGATAFPKGQILTDRNEGRLLASAEIDGKWFGVSKTVLTACTSRGHDALLTDVPVAALEVLRLTCGRLILTPL